MCRGQGVGRSGRRSSPGGTGDAPMESAIGAGVNGGLDHGVVLVAVLALGLVGLVTGVGMILALVLFRGARARPEYTGGEGVTVFRTAPPARTKGRGTVAGCFISYTHVDCDFVDKLRDGLTTEGIDVWLDRKSMVAGTIQDQVWQ